MSRLVVPQHAKAAASAALRLRRSLPKSRKFGLKQSQADRLGISSGVSRAKQLINSKSISLDDACRVAAFYLRFRGCRSQKCEGAIGLWGGRRFGQMAAAHCKKHRRQSP